MPANPAFNPNDKGSLISLSKTLLPNDTAINTNAGTWNSVRSLTSASAGKLYLEVIDISGGVDIVCGVGTNGFSLSNFVGATATSCGIQSATGTNTIVANGFTLNSTTSPGYAANDVFQIALDFGGGNLWFGKNNTWVTGNPGTNTSPTATFTAGTTLFPAVGLINSGSAQIVCNGSKFATPTGYTLWSPGPFFSITGPF